MSNKPTTFRLDFIHREKLEDIKRDLRLDTMTDVIKYLIHDYENEDKEIRQLKLIIENLQRKLDHFEKSIEKKESSSRNEDDIIINNKLDNILAVVIELAKTNPRTNALMKSMFPDHLKS